MICPRCNCEYIRVVDTMPDEEQRIFRRRKCPECGFIFHTVETIYVKKRKTGLTPIKQLPPKEYKYRRDNVSLCEEFMRMGVKYARVDLCDNEGGDFKSAYSTLHQVIIRNGYPFYITTRNGYLYFVRVDMEET